MGDLQNTVGEINKANGWHDTTATPVERIALIMTEAAEAIEEIRNGHDVQETYYQGKKPEGGAKRDCGHCYSMLRLRLRLRY